MFHLGKSYCKAIRYIIYYIYDFFWYAASGISNST
jgi:hypothetical protein